MCGICGIASTRGTVDPGRLAAMSATLVHRGPDSDGSFVEGPVGLAARRLAIIDLATGDQPIANEDGTDHRRPERRDLQLPRAAARARARRPPLLDERRHRGARPPLRGARRALRRAAARHVRLRALGLRADNASCSRATASGSSRSTTARPDGELAFASELRALPRGEIDLDALEAFLAFNSVPGPLTIFRDVRKLPPGHVLTWERRTHRADALRAAGAGRGRRGAATTRRRSSSRSCARGCATRSARTSSRDVPVGVLLSGGVDSSVLAALAAEEASEPLRTFSIGFEERSFDELADARLVAERYGTDHHELVLRPDAALLLPALAEAFDEPFADSSALPTYLVSQARGRGREGRALRRGRRRALRRLLHVRGRPARRAGRRGPRRCCGRSSSGCRAPPAAGRASTTRRSASSAPRTCRRSSATTAGRRSSRRAPGPS